MVYGIHVFFLGVVIKCLAALDIPDTPCTEYMTRNRLLDITPTDRHMFKTCGVWVLKW